MRSTPCSATATRHCICGSWRKPCRSFCSAAQRMPSGHRQPNVTSSSHRYPLGVSYPSAMDWRKLISHTGLLLLGRCSRW